MSRVAAALAVIIVLSAALSAPAGGEFDPREIIGLAVEGMGGSDVLDAIKGMTVKARGTFQGMPYETDLTWFLDGRISWTLDAGMFQGAMGTNGKVCWSHFGSPPARLRGGALKNMQSWSEHQHILLLRPLLTRKDLTIEARAAMPGTPKEGEKPWIRRLVRVTFPSGLTYDLLFLTANDVTRLVGVKGDMIHMDDRQGTLKWKLGSPKKFGEITMPSKLATQTFVGKKLRVSMDEEYVEIVWNPEVEAATFAMPEAEIDLDSPGLGAIADSPSLVLVHQGPYETIGKTLAKAAQIVADADLMTSLLAHITLVYLTDPNMVKDPAAQRTEVWLPASVKPGQPAPLLPAGATLRVLPAARVASITVRGAYGTVEGEAISRLMGWVAVKGHQVAGAPRQQCLHDPRATVPEDQVSVIQIPIK